MADPFKDSQQIARAHDQLSKRMEELRRAYDAYFQGLRKDEPLKLKHEVQGLVRSLSGLPIQNAALKFRISQTIARFGTLEQLWSRILRQKEEGRYEKDLFLARLHEAQRLGKPIDELVGSSGSPKPSQGPESKASSPSIDPLFEAFVKAREKCGEPTKGLSPEKFKQTLEQQRQALSAKVPQGKKLEFKVVIENGASKLKAVLVNAPPAA